LITKVFHLGNFDRSGRDGGRPLHKTNSFADLELPPPVSAAYSASCGFRQPSTAIPYPRR
jgi:hypothetical protein